MHTCKRSARRGVDIETSLLPGQLSQASCRSGSLCWRAGTEPPSKRLKHTLTCECTFESPVPKGNGGNPSSFPVAPLLLLRGRISVHRRQTLAANMVSCNCYYLGSSDPEERCAICKSKVFALPSKRSKREGSNGIFRSHQHWLALPPSPAAVLMPLNKADLGPRNVPPGMNWLPVWKCDSRSVWPSLSQRDQIWKPDTGATWSSSPQCCRPALPHVCGRLPRIEIGSVRACLRAGQSLG